MSKEHFREIVDKFMTLEIIWDYQANRLLFHSIPFQNLLSLVLPSSFTILTKIVMQTIWLESLSWDDPFPDHLVQQWQKIQSNVLLLGKVLISCNVIYQNARDALGAWFLRHIFSLWRVRLLVTHLKRWNCDNKLVKQQIQSVFH